MTNISSVLYVNDIKFNIFVAVYFIAIMLFLYYTI